MKDLKSQISLELKLLAILSLPEIKDKHINTASALIEKVDFLTLRKLLDTHRVLSCAYCNIRDHFSSLLPNEIIESLKNEHDQNVVICTKQFIAYRKVLSEFKKANIPVSTLKGIPLAEKLYGDVAKRYMKDIDLLVPIESVDQASAILNRLHFRNDDFNNLSPIQRSRYFDTAKDIAYLGDTGVILELHTRLARYQISLLYKGVTKSNSKGINELLYLCWHGSHTLYHRLKWILDISLYLEQFQNEPYFNLDRLIEESKNQDALRPLIMSWILANLLYGNSIPQKIDELYIKDDIAQLLVKKSLARLNSHKQLIAFEYPLENIIFKSLLLRNWHSKYIIFMKILMPNMRDFKFFPGIPDKFYWMYFILRPIRLLFKHLRG